MRGKKINSRERRAKLHSDPVFRKQVFKELLDHILRGRSMDCFYAMTEDLVREFTKLYPSEFDVEEIAQAQRQAKDHWEQIGHNQALGTCLGNSRSWYYNMSNRYGWTDRVDVKAKTEGTVSVNIVSYSSKKPPQVSDKPNDTQ